MAATGNPFAELERMGGLEPFASRREILEQLQLCGENDMEEVAADKLPRALSSKVGKFSDAELDAFESEGWSVVAPRARTRHDAADLVEAAVPRALPTGISPQQTTPATQPTMQRPWKLFRWGALGVLGVLALAKLANRR